jgi:hypothetical protein
VALSPEHLSRLDAEYLPIEPFARWADLRVDQGLWDRYLSRLDDLRQTRPDRAAETDEKSLRKAALHTGALEGLHSADRGVTSTVVRADSWRRALEDEAGGETLRHVEAAIERSTSFWTWRRALSPWWR